MTRVIKYRLFSLVLINLSFASICSSFVYSETSVSAKTGPKTGYDTSTFVKAGNENSDGFYPLAPSMLKYEKSSLGFTRPQKCAMCHRDKYEEWNGSMHSLAFTDPIYQGELNTAIKAVGHKIGKQCEGCHSPAAVVNGEIKGAGLKGLSPLAKAGVSCDVCHSISGHTHWQTPFHEPGNGSLVLSPGKDTKKGGVRTKYGPASPGPGCGMGFHKCIKSSLHLKSELCASCHQIMHHETHIPLEATYKEWKNGPYSANNIHCQDCHMVDIKTFKRSADTMVRPDLNEYHHYFNGPNFLIYHLNELAAKKIGDEKLASSLHHKYEMAVERLKAAAELDISPVYEKGKLIEIKVQVKNTRAGHNLPTSLTVIRQMWLEVTLSDNNNTNDTDSVLMTTGTVNDNGELPDNVRIFNSKGQDKDFKTTIHPWEITSFSKHDTIPPKGYKNVYFGVPSLATLKGKLLKVEVKLRYRQASQKVAGKLLGLVPGDIHLEAVYGITEIPKLPIIDMVKKVVVLESLFED